MGIPARRPGKAPALPGAVRKRRETRKTNGSGAAPGAGAPAPGSSPYRPPMAGDVARPVHYRRSKVSSRLQRRQETGTMAEALFTLVGGRDVV